MVKYFILLFLFVFIFLGIGCRFVSQEEKNSYLSPFSEGLIYQSENYGFLFDYPKNIEVEERPLFQQQTMYLNIPVQFFLSIKQPSKEISETTENIFYLYVTENIADIQTFQEQLEASDPENIQVLSTEHIEQNGLALTKIISTTALGVEKTHYLFWQENTLIIFSQFLHQEDIGQQIISTLRQA